MMRVTKSKLVALYAKHTDEKIGAIYGVTGRSVGDWRKHYGIPRKEPTRRYTLDRDFFEKIDTPEKAYALGFIASDGSIHRSGKQVSISLQARDEQILRDLRKVMGSNAPIRDKIAGGFPGSGPQRALTFDSKKLVTDLARHGVGPKKSLTLQYPRLRRDLEAHFARGIFDGDGHIRAVPKKLFYFLGTEHLIRGLCEAIFRHTGVALNVRRIEGHLWRISGYGGSSEVLEWMYQDATVRLKRKERVFLTYW